ncbi:MAG: hypothetical protein JO112_17455, partial [Planctomycetes bacterium]|nr:hypothetical protein [Planctomycetota bacterium]
LWWNTKHLLTGRSHEDALRLLDEFWTKGGDRQIHDPLKRAVLQHDLWTVFEWTAHPFGYHSGTEEYPAARRALQQRLAQAIHRLALPASVMASLPDNYAAAVKSRAFATRFDPQQPEKPFLPDDLFDPQGPWVCAGSSSNFGPTPVALAHTRFYSGRSVFLAFLHLPGDRKATLDYLNKLNNVPSPWVLQPRQPNTVHTGDLFDLSPHLPQFPVGTQVALVRQMVLPTDAGQLAATPITESVQFRVYRRIGTKLQESDPETEQSQSFFEFDLQRADLFAGQAGGLHPVPADEAAYITLQNITGSDDFFESSGERRVSHLCPVLKTCVACHGGPGIYSVNSFNGRFSGHLGHQVDLALWPSDVPHERQEVLTWKQQQYDWGLLQGFSALP